MRRGRGLTVKRSTGLAAVIATMAAAGCGGDSGPSLSEFAADANKVCADGGAEIRKLEQPNGARAGAKYASDLSRILQDGAKELKGLERPSGDDGKKAKEFVDTYEADIENEYVPALEKVEQAGESGDAQATAQAFQDIENVKTPESDKLAKDIGAPSCAE